MRWVNIILIIVVLASNTSQAAVSDEQQKLRNCLCSCLEPKGGRFSCSYDTEDRGYSPSCRKLSNGPCICKAFGCFRANMPTTGECYDRCRTKQTTRDATTGSTVTTTTDPDDKELTLKGRVTDGFGHPIKYAKVTVKHRGLFHTTATDDDGNYELEFRGKDDAGEEARLYVKLEYHRNNKVYFRILYGGKPVHIMKKFRIDSESDLNVDFDLRGGLEPANGHYGSPHPKWIRHFSKNYFHMTEVLEFYIDELKVGVDYKLPVDVRACVPGGKTYYSSGPSTITIARKHCGHGHRYAPMNREWHEFNHHVMFSLYRKWPAGWRLPNTRNHAGYINPSTADAFLEGFAEFMAMVQADKLGYPRPHVYSSFGSWEVDYKAWGDVGRDEEIAVAGILWDLYDGKNDDQVDFTFEQVWNIIKNYHPDFTSVYNAFIKAYPREREGIDEIFVEHGYFADKTEGNKIRDPQEPFRDADGDKAYDAGEYFIDYAQEPNWAIPHMIRQDNEKVGSATNYQRPNRTNMDELPGHYIKAPGEKVEYTVEVKFKDRPEYNYQLTTANEGGLIYVQVPPREYKTEITVEPKQGGKPFTFTSEEFEEKQQQAIQRGYFTEHDFGLPATEAFEDESTPAPGLETQDRPYWSEKTNEAEDEDYFYEPVEDEKLPDYGGMPSVPWWALLIAGGTMMGLVLAVVVVAAAMILIAGVVWWLKKRKKSSS